MNAVLILITVVQLLVALALILIVLFQSGKSQGLSGAIGGIADSYMSRSKAKSMDAKLARGTKWVAAVFVVLTLVLIIQRFNRNLLKDEGYLMFTLPVSVHSLLFSKLLSALLWCVLGGCVGLLSIALMTMIAMDASQWGEFWAVIHQLIHNVDLEIAGNLGLIGLLALMEGVSFLMTIYLSLSVGQIPTFNRYRGLMAFITFLAITVITSWLTGSWLTGIPAFLHAGDVSAFSPQAMVGLYILYDVVVSALFYGGTWLILTKKLNLE